MTYPGAWVPHIFLFYFFIGKLNDEHYNRYSDFKTTTTEKLAKELESKGITTLINPRTLPLGDSLSTGRKLLKKTSALSGQASTILARLPFIS